MSSTVTTISLHVAALAAAGLGGALAALIGFPAPWLSGAMLVSGILAASDRFPPMPVHVRDFAMLLSGITIGTGVRPETLHALAAVPLSIALLFAAIVMIVIACSAVLMRFFGWKRIDAVLASVPGALSSILLIAHERQADITAIAAVQLFRLIMLILILPPLIAVGSALPVVDSTTSAMSFASVAGLAAAALPAGLLLHRLQVPAALLLGAMLASATLTGSGIVAGDFPDPLASLGFTLIGAFIGERFRSMRRRDLVRLAPAALAAFVVSTIVAVAFAEAASLLLGVSQAAALMAFAPGGLEAMAILAFTLAIDPVYVAAHHLVRFMAIGLTVPLIFRARPSWFGVPPDPPQR